MPRIHPLAPSFNAGELSPRLSTRTDFAKYPAGVETMLNLRPLPEGGAMRRPGTRYVAAAKSSSVKGRLKRFQFSATQPYILELSNLAMRFFRNQAQVVVADTDAAVTNGTFTSNITDWDDRSTGGAGNEITHDSTNGRLNLTPSGTAADDIGWAEQDITTTATGTEHTIKFRVIGAPGDKIEFQVGTASTGAQTLAVTKREVGYHCISFTPTTSPFYIQFLARGSDQNKTVQIDDVSIIDDSALEIDTPYAEADLYTIEGPQSADVLYLFHASYPTYKLQRFGDTSWSLTEVAWQDGPYLEQNSTSTTLTAASATGLGVTLTASSIIGINDDEGFKTTDVGRLVRLTDSATINWGWGVIVGWTSTTVVTVDVKRTFTVTTAETTWRLGSWSGTTGYPQASSFYEQRLFCAGTTEQPQTFWASQTSDFENMAPDSANSSGVWNATVEDDDGLDYTLSADNVNVIRWLSAGEDTLAIGTVGGEWVPSSSGGVLTPTDITVRRQTTHGSAKIQPVRVDNIVLFVQRAGRKIREFGFSFDVDGYKAPDMTRLAQHITYGGIVEMDYAEEPDSTLYAVRTDGVLLSMTYRRDEDVVGWSRNIIGGSFGSGDAVVESVVVIPGNDGSGQTHDSSDRDEVWVQVKRTIDGNTARYIEFFERDYENGHDQEDAYYADSLITYDGASTASITGLDHLEGETVRIWADGSIQASKTVASGAITLDIAASVVQVGLAYTHRLKTLKVEGGNPAGTSVGKKKRIYGATFALLNSHIMSYGPDTGNLLTKDFRQVSDEMDEQVPLFTGEQTLSFNGNYGTDTRIIVESDAPAPFTLLAIAPEIQMNALK